MVSIVRAERDERDALLGFLEAQRGNVRRAALGLSEEQAKAAPSASALSVGGLIKHLAAAERLWIRQILAGEAPPPGFDHAREQAQSFRVGPGETLAGLLAHYADVARETEEYIRGLPDLERTVPVPMAPGSERSARWVLLHLIAETARHAGHADIVRESLDGAVSSELIAAEERQTQDA